MWAIYLNWDTDTRVPGERKKDFIGITCFFSTQRYVLVSICVENCYGKADDNARIFHIIRTDISLCKN